MMNKFDGSGGKAHIRYDDADYHVLVPGTHVVCAITGKTIMLDELKYWSVARQEAYVDVNASLEAELRARPGA